MITSVNKLTEWLDIVVTIVCWHKMALVVFLQEDEDLPSVYRCLKIFCETAPGFGSHRWFLYITTLLLPEASWLLYCIMGHPNPASAPSILVVLLEHHCIQILNLSDRLTKTNLVKFVGVLYSFHD